MSKGLSIDIYAASRVYIDVGSEFKIPKLTPVRPLQWRRRSRRRPLRHQPPQPKALAPDLAGNA